MRVDLLWHYLGGEVMGTFASVFHVDIVTSVIGSNILFFAKEIHDISTTGFDVVDIIFGNLGLFSGMF